MENMATKRNTKRDAADGFEEYQDYLRPEGSRYCDGLTTQSDAKAYSFLIPDFFMDEEIEALEY